MPALSALTIPNVHLLGDLSFLAAVPSLARTLRQLRLQCLPDGRFALAHDEQHVHPLLSLLSLRRLLLRAGLVVESPSLRVSLESSLSSLPGWVGRAWCAEPWPAEEHAIIARRERFSDYGDQFSADLSRDCGCIQDDVEWLPDE